MNVCERESERERAKSRIAKIKQNQNETNERMNEWTNEKYDDFKEENAIITKLGMYLQCAYESSNKLPTIFHNTHTHTHIVSGQACASKRVHTKKSKNGMKISWIVETASSHHIQINRQNNWKNTTRRESDNCQRKKKKKERQQQQQQANATRMKRVLSAQIESEAVAHSIFRFSGTDNGERDRERWCGVSEAAPWERAMNNTKWQISYKSLSSNLFNCMQKNGPKWAKQQQRQPQTKWNSCHDDDSKYTCRCLLLVLLLASTFICAGCFCCCCCGWMCVLPFSANHVEICMEFADQPFTVHGHTHSTAFWMLRKHIKNVNSRLNGWKIDEKFIETLVVD